VKPTRPSEAVNYLVLFIVVMGSGITTDTGYGNLRFRISDMCKLMSERKKITAPSADRTERKCDMVTML